MRSDPEEARADDKVVEGGSSAHRVVAEPVDARARRDLRVAVALEQCWHRVPGGTAQAAVETVRALERRPGVDLVGVSARHSRQPPTAWRPSIPVAQLLLPRAALYAAWNRGRWRVTRATGPVDVIWATGYVVPPRSAPLVVTWHDFAFQRYPEYFTSHGRRFFDAALARAKADADLLLCSSSATRDDALAAGFDSTRLRVVPLGVEPVEVTDADVAGTRARHHLDRPFVLCVSTVEPRKNIGRLIDAFGRIADDHPDVDLVIAGPEGWNEDLEARLEALRDRVHRIGFVTESDKAALYRGAAVVCYPSLWEGFGLPALEAMAQGAPVVTSAGTTVEEVVGTAALIVDPRDTDAIADAMARVLDDTELAGRLRDAGRERAAAFSWDRTAELTEIALRDAAAAAS